MSLNNLLAITTLFTAGICVTEAHESWFLHDLQDAHVLIKRQTSAPVFGQSSYQFTLSSCTAGSNVGTISSTGTSGTTTYTLDPASVQGFYVTIGSISGQITLTTNAPASFTFYARASNTAGTVSVPVTVTCGSSTSSTSSSTYPYSTYPYTTVNTYPYSAVSTYPYSTVNTGSYGTQSLTGSNCNNGGIVGNVYIAGTAGYFITSGQFSINANTGQISLAATLGTGTYSVIVQAVSSSGQPVSIPVTITMICTGYPSSSYPLTSYPGSTYPVTYPITTYPVSYTGYTTTTTGSFGQSSYSFSTSTCTAGTSAGTVYASGATGYTITSGNSGQFTISTSGTITLASTVAAGTYSLQVQSYGSVAATATVTITVSCSGTSTGTTTTVNGLPTFNQGYYAFTVTTCSTSATSVGQVSATGASSYSINSGSGMFTIDNNGNISSVAGALTTGTKSVTVVATGSTGKQIAIPVTITVNCTG